MHSWDAAGSGRSIGRRQATLDRLRRGVLLPVLHALVSVRTSLGDHIDMPPGMSETRGNQGLPELDGRPSAIGTYDHLPGWVVDTKTMELQYVSALTVASTLPDSIAKEIAKLISAAPSLLDEVLDPVRERLERALRTADPETLVAAAPRAINKEASEFQPRSKRARYPTEHTFYWDRRD